MSEERGVAKDQLNQAPRPEGKASRMSGADATLGTAAGAILVAGLAGGALYALSLRGGVLLFAMATAAFLFLLGVAASPMAAVHQLAVRLLAATIPTSVAIAMIVGTGPMLVAVLATLACILLSSYLLGGLWRRYQSAGAS